MSRLFRLSLIQMAVGANKSENIAKACELYRKVVAQSPKPHMVVLPECFNSPYGVKHFPEYAERIPEGDTCHELSRSVASGGVPLISGSIPERRGDKLFNTCMVFDRDGTLVGTYSKIHLFDIDIPGGITFRESSVLSPGDTRVLVEVSRASGEPPVNLGVGICYDMRFPRLAHGYGPSLHCLIYPGAFNMTTGPKHWQLVQQARALDCQCFVTSCAPARCDTGGYVSFAHSMVVDPWTQVVADLGTDETCQTVELDLNLVETVRSQIPISTQQKCGEFASDQLELPLKTVRVTAGEE